MTNLFKLKCKLIQKRYENYIFLSLTKNKKIYILKSTKNLKINNKLILNINIKTFCKKLIKINLIIIKKFKKKFIEKYLPHNDKFYVIPINQKMVHDIFILIFKTMKILI